MKINKMIWVFALVFILSSTTVFAFIHGSLSGFFRSPYVIFIANTLIIWIIFLIAQSFIIKSQDAKVKVIVWIATLALAVIIAWNIVDPPGSAYLWEAGWLAQYLGIKFLVNMAIIAAAGYFGLGFLGVDTQKTEGKIGMALLVIFAAGLIAHNIGDKWLWDDDNVKGLYKYLLGPEKNTGKKIIKGGVEVDETEGGILRPEGPPKGQYRLLVFVIASLVFSWFLIGFLNITTGGNRLSIAMALIIAGSLAHRGESLDMVRNMAEVLSFLIVLKQIPPDIFAGGAALPGVGAVVGAVTGFVGTGLRYLVAGLLVGWVFCTAFGTSTIGEVINQIPGVKQLGIDPCPAKACVKDPDCPTGKICGPEKKCVKKEDPTKGPPKGRGPPGASGPPTGKPFGCFWC